MHILFNVRSLLMFKCLLVRSSKANDLSFTAAAEGKIRVARNDSITKTIVGSETTDQGSKVGLGYMSREISIQHGTRPKNALSGNGICSDSLFDSLDYFQLR